MNTSFVAELFQSKEFASDYQEFLSNYKSVRLTDFSLPESFHEIMVIDNSRKIEKFITCLENCYSTQSIEVILPSCSLANCAIETEELQESPLAQLLDL